MSTKEEPLIDFDKIRNSALQQNKKFHTNKVISKTNLAKIRNPELRRQISRVKDTSTDNALTSHVLSDLLVNTIDNTSSNQFISQDELYNNTTTGNQAKRWSVSLPNNSSSAIVKYSLDGSEILMGTKQRGYFSLINSMKNQVKFEIDLSIESGTMETIRDISFVNRNVYAAAQKSSTFLYNDCGVEIVNLRPKGFLNISSLDYLPYHYLLCGAGDKSDLKWLDVSTGDVICRHYTKSGFSPICHHNRSNGVMGVSSTQGYLRMFVPNSPDPVIANFRPHRGKLTDFIMNGNLIVTSGADGYLKVWDLRKIREDIVDDYMGIADEFAIASHKIGYINSMDMSIHQRLVLGFPKFVGVVNNLTDSELTYSTGAPSIGTTSIAINPFDDVVLIGSSNSVSTMLAPGVGYPRFDSRENNPFASAKQKKSLEVRKLLEKLQPDMISLDADSQFARVKRQTGDKNNDKSDVDLIEKSTNIANKKGKSKHRLQMKNKEIGKIKRQIVNDKINEREDRENRYIIDKIANDANFIDFDSDEDDVPEDPLKEVKRVALTSEKKISHIQDMVEKHGVGMAMLLK